MLKPVTIGCLLTSLGLFASVSVWALTSESIPRAEGHEQMIETRIRKPYLEGVTGTDRQFLIHRHADGFREIEHLFLGALAGSTSIIECCDKKPQKQISLHLADPYYVRIGSQVVFIEKVDMAWPRGWGEQTPFLILNERLAMTPAPTNRSFNLLAEWANQRGFR